jgi:hypothetical protein
LLRLRPFSDPNGFTGAAARGAGETPALPGEAIR